MGDKRIDASGLTKACTCLYPRSNPSTRCYVHGPAERERLRRLNEMAELGRKHATRLLPLTPSELDSDEEKRGS